jgi:protein ECT2
MLQTKVVLHIDELGTSDPVPFGVNGPPFVSIRVQPIAGALCRYKVTSNDPNEENEEDIVQIGRVSDRVIHTSEFFMNRTSPVNVTCYSSSIWPVQVPHG